VRMRVLFREAKQQLLAGRACTYTHLAERAKEGGQEKLVQQFRNRGLRDCLRLMDLDPASSYGYINAGIILQCLGIIRGP